MPWDVCSFLQLHYISAEDLHALAEILFNKSYDIFLEVKYGGGGIEKAENAIFTIEYALLVLYLCENRIQRINAILSVKVQLNKQTNDW